LYVLILMPFLALLADYCAGILGMNSPGPAVMLMICIITGLIVITFVNLVAYTTASISFRKGYDPDNFGIPVITSFIDLIGATMLVTVIYLMI
ncbi:MAG: magnesium transporter, partial [Methanomicrobium sp.]|nr:magnesium transporter [Methanomicrobium sp.]